MKLVGFAITWKKATPDAFGSVGVDTLCMECVSEHAPHYAKDEWTPLYDESEEKTCALCGEDMKSF